MTAHVLGVYADACAPAPSRGTLGCWGIALGGTRRAYLAQGGHLRDASDLADYYAWIAAAQQRLFDDLYDRGVGTIIAIGRLAADRGPVYLEAARRAIAGVLDGDGRAAWYRTRGLQVSVAGDLAQLGRAVGDEGLADRADRLRRATGAHRRGQLIYLFRGAWVDAAEEAQWGWRVGQAIGGPPARDDLVAAFYGLDVPPLDVYIGSGRPRIGVLRPPFLTGREDLYWAETCPVRLTPAAWAAIVADHQEARRTESGRRYAEDPASRELLAAAITAGDDHVIGLGRRHPLGFWMPRRHGADEEKGTG